MLHNPFVGSSRNARIFLDFSLCIATISIVFVVVWLLLPALDLAPELSDSGFYLLNHRENEHVLTVFSGFGVLLKALFGEPSVKVMRLVNIAAIFAGPTLFVFITTGKSDLAKRIALRFGLSFLAGTAGWTYFKWLLLDPSYNSLTIPLFFFTMTAYWSIATRIAAHDYSNVKSIIGWSLAGGASITAFALNKITSGALLSVALTVPILALFTLQYTSQRPINRKALYQIALSGLGGALLLIGLIWLRVYSPVELFQRAMNGLETTQLLGTHRPGISGSWKQFVNVLPFTQQSVVGAWIGLCAASASLGLAHFRDRTVNLLSMTFALIAIVALTHRYWVWKTDLLRAGHLTLALGMLSAGYALIHIYRQPIMALVAVILSLSPFILTYGTETPWYAHLMIYSGLVTTAFVFISAFEPRTRLLFIPVSIVATTGILYATLDTGLSNPYRMENNIKTVGEPIMVQGETFRLAKSLAPTYEAIRGFRRDPTVIPNSAERPILIDMSGRLPTLTWALDFTPAKMAWTLSGYKGSNLTLDWALSRHSSTELSNAWILLREDGKGLNIDVLNNHLIRLKKRFPDDYRQVLKIPINYIDATVQLFEPIIKKVE